MNEKIKAGIGLKNARGARLEYLHGRTATNSVITSGKPIWFPVAPSTLGVTSSSNWNIYRVTDSGEFANRGGRNLKIIEIETFLPPYYIPALCQGLRFESDFQEPEKITKRLEAICDQQLIVRFAVGTTGPSVIIDMPVRLTEFTWSETSKMVGARQIFCRLEEYRHNQVMYGGKTEIPPIPKKFQLREGEDLQDAALRIYGDIRAAEPLANVNRIETVSRNSSAARTVGTSVAGGANSARTASQRVVRVINTGNVARFW